MNAQALNNQIKDVVMPSPNAASLGKYGDIPVSYHTGVPNVGIPIYTLQEGLISLPISLSYHAGGVKVGEPCSWVGLNWSLQAGGMISRTIQGIADESINGYMNNKLILAQYGLNSGPTPITPQDIAAGAKDGEPDIFSFSVGGYSGKFYMDASESVPLSNTAYIGKAIAIPKQDVKIEYFLTAAYSANRLFKFKITTPEGAIYEFGDIGDGSPVIEVTQSNVSFQTANGWYLKKITSPDLVSTIDLTYTAEEYRQYSKKSPGSTSGSSSGGVLGVDYMDYKGWRLNTITTQSGGLVSPERVSFVAGNLRDDILQVNSSGVANTGKESKVLNAIKIENGAFSSTTSPCKYFTLSQSYWTDNVDAFVPMNGAGIEANKRLRLDAVQEQNCYTPVTMLPPTTFSYYNQSGNVNFLPNRYSSAVDHWGYYNGANTNPKGGFNIPYTHLHYLKVETGLYVDYAMGTSNRETDEASMKLGTLQTITYPTGGKTTFDYEANTYWDTTSVKSLQDITSLANFWPGVNCTATLPLVPTIATTPNITPPSFTANEITNTLFYKVESLGGPQPGSTGTPCASPVLPLIEIYAFPANNPTVSLPVVTISTSSDQSTVVQQGMLKDLFPSLQAGLAYTFVTRVKASGVKFTIQREIVTPSAINRKVGGLRVKQITSNDTLNAANNIVKTYTYTNDNTTQSSALLYSKPSYSATYNDILTAYGNNNVAISKNVSFHVFTDYSIVPLGSFEGATVGYSNVKEYLGDGAYTKYTYFQEPVQSYAGTPVPPTQPRIEAGNLSTKLQLNSAGITVASETNTINPDIYTNGVGTYYKIINNNTLFQSAPTAFAVTYSIRNKPYRLSSMVSVLDGVSTTTNYAYDAGTLPKRTETVTNSNGVATTSTYFYASDPTSLVNNASNSDLSSRNMIGFPIKVRQVTGTSTKWSKVDYFLFNTNQIEPQYLRECFEATPVNWIDRLKITGYTTNGMPSMIFKNNFTVPESYTWDAIYPKLLRIKTFGNVADKILTWKIDYNIVGTVGNSLVEKMTDENGLIKKYTYDRLMRLQMVQDRMDAAGANTQATTTYTYQYKDATNPLNYIGTSTTFVNATNTTPLSTKQYMDGLGRPVSTVRESYIPNTTNQQKNNITYDALGRQYRAFLPFASTTLGYEAAATSPVTYTQTEYELSPLSRPIKQTNVDATIVQTSYGSNLASEVRLFTIPSIGTVSSTAYYVANLLYKVTMTDENNNQTVIFKDKLGRVILTRKFLSGANIDTYNVYDDFNQLVAVLPPGSVDATGVVTYSLIFQYYYDFKNRLAQKKVPGADLQTFYYDNRDLMVLTQDGNMRATSSTKYLATLYDELGRVMKTGFATVSPATNMDFTLTDAQITDKLTETQYYPNSSWVKNQGAKVLKPLGITTLRDFIWSYIERRATVNYTGNPVWTGKQHLLSETFRNNAIQTIDEPITDNDYGGVDWSVNAYDGLQKPTATYRNLYSIDANQTVRTYNTFVYDNGQRLTHNKYTYAVLGSAPDYVTTPPTLANMNYNFKDQLIEKNTALVGTKYLQSVDYAYNLRGWLTNINSGFLNSSLDYPLFNSASTTLTVANNYVSLATSSYLTPAAQAGEDNPDLFKETLSYANPTLYSGLGSVVAQNNGNISQVESQVAGRESQIYSLYYDGLDRLTDAKYTDLHSTGWAGKGWANASESDNKYKETATYDVRGNILSMNRNGLTATTLVTTSTAGKFLIAGTFAATDNMAYVYGDSNRLKKVTDVALTAKGFIYANTGDTRDYAYDNNGNLIADRNKGITNITYNHLNLPITITFTNTVGGLPRRLEFIYDATGMKLRKTVYLNSIATETHDYVNGIEYIGGVLERFVTTEGAVVRQGTTTTYAPEYTIKDHLGNARVTYADANNDGLIVVSEIKQINAYYPFGMNMESNFNGADGLNKYQYNGKELNQDFGLNWNDYGARFYDAALGRWTAKDALSEKAYSFSPYAYGSDNPISMRDLDGNYAVSVHYEITYQALRDLGYSEQKADIMAHYASVYADHPESGATKLDMASKAWTRGNWLKAEKSIYRIGIDYSPTAESQAEANSDWHSMMSNLEADLGMTQAEALKRGLHFGWSKLFEFAKGGGKNLGQFGQGIHALQDAAAHRGARTSDHLGVNISSANMMLNDVYGDTGAAFKLTRSAIIVTELLQGNKAHLRSGDKLTFEGMDSSQKREVISALATQGFTIQGSNYKK